MAQKDKQQQYKNAKMYVKYTRRELESFPKKISEIFSTGDGRTLWLQFPDIQRKLQSFRAMHIYENVCDGRGGGHVGFFSLTGKKRAAQQYLPSLRRSNKCEKGKVQLLQVLFLHGDYHPPARSDGRSR